MKKLLNGCVAAATISVTVLITDFQIGGAAAFAAAKTTKASARVSTTVKKGAVAASLPGAGAKKGLGDATVAVPGAPGTPTIMRISLGCSIAGCDFQGLKADGTNAGLQPSDITTSSALAGSYLFNYFGASTDAAASIKITAKSWTYDFVPLTSVRTIAAGQTISGEGAEVLAVKGVVSIGTVKGGAGGPGKEYFDLRSYSISDNAVEETFVAQEISKGVNGPITLPPDTRYLAVTTRTPWTLTVR